MDYDKELKTPYPMADVEKARKTRERIILEATVLFAQRGYSTVSVRDIAEKVNMKAASLYNHFASKEVLWDEVLDNIKTLYLLYFERLETAIARATSFKEVLNYMFVELQQIVNIFTYYGFSLIQAEQFRDSKAYDIYRGIFLEYSIEFIKGKFDECIAKGWAREFETLTTARFFMHSVLTGIMIRTHEDMNQNIPYDVSEMFASLHKHIYDLGRKE